MNQKVQQLLNDGVITISELLEYAQNYMDACDQLDDEQIDKYYQEEYVEDYDPCYEMTDEEKEYERMRMLDEKYGDYLNEEMELSLRSHSSTPEYVVASTSFKLEETIIFESDENGRRLNSDDYGGAAKRWTNDNNHDYMNYRDVVQKCMGDNYEFVRRTWQDEDCIQNLFKRVDKQ